MALRLPRQRRRIGAQEGRGVGRCPIGNRNARANSARPADHGRTGSSETRWVRCGCPRTRSGGLRPSARSRTSRSRASDSAGALSTPSGRSSGRARWRIATSACSRPTPPRPSSQLATRSSGGDLDDHFPLDVFQTGSGTSTNMNANEVIATRAMQLPGGVRTRSDSSQRSRQHEPVEQRRDPHGDPRGADPGAAGGRSCPRLRSLPSALGEKATAFDGVVKTGRTHLQDATPDPYGPGLRRLRGAGRARHGAAGRPPRRCASCRWAARRSGPGMNCPPGFPARAIARLNEAPALTFVEAENHVEARRRAGRGVVEASGHSGRSRWPAQDRQRRALDGFGAAQRLGELRLPPVQPGSSIMPGKVNPVSPRR